VQARLQVKRGQVDLIVNALHEVKGGAPKAIAWAINRTLRPMRTAMSKELRKVYNLPARLVRDHLRIHKAAANRSLLKGSVEASGWPIPLMDFVGTRQTKRGVSVKVLKAKGRRRLRHAFITTLKSGHTGVFQRQYDPLKGRVVGRLPIEELLGPAVPASLENQQVWREIERQAQERLEHELDSRVAYLLEKNGLPSHRKVA
jgi:hypothetical protein